MGKLDKGIFGSFSGKVGDKVGAHWRDLEVMRSMPRPSSKPPTAAQLAQRHRFGMVTDFLQPLGYIQNRYFGHPRRSKSRRNLALSYTLKEATEVVNDSPEILYNRFMVTKGTLPGFQNAEVTPQAGAELQFSWADNSSLGDASATDQVNVVFYSKDTESWEIYGNVALRPDESAVVTVSSMYVGLDIEVYLYLTHESEDKASNSQYMGTVTVL